MIAEKKCKASGPAIRHESCGKMVSVEYRKYGMCPSCYAGWIRNTEAGQLKLKKASLTAKKTVDKVKESDKKELVKELTDWAKKTQDKVNEIVRRIDYDLKCLARGYAGQMHAGHVYARGGNSSMRFNLHNIHRQCAQSNRFQNDDGLLREGVVKEYGQSYMDFISELRRTPQIKKTNAEFHEIYLKASKIALQYKKADLRFETTSDRIAERNQVNLELGIYDQEYCIF